MALRLPAARPSHWLLLDACGALATALTHAVVLQTVFPFTGMPDGRLSALAVTAAGFATYSVVSWILATQRIVTQATAGRLLRIVALANVMYCLLTLGLVFRYWDVLSGWGVVYFVAEVTVVCLLARLEWRVGMRSPAVNT